MREPRYEQLDRDVLALHVNSAASEGITHYTRRFECGACSTEWTDKWCSDCDDECPCCGTVMTSLEVLEEDILESAR